MLSVCCWGAPFISSTIYGWRTMLKICKVCSSTILQPFHYPIFHGPCHMWPGFFECLQLKNLLSKKNLKKLYSWRSVFSIFFTSGLSPYNDAFLTYSAKRKKNPKMQVIWDLGRGNPATLEGKHRACHVTAPPPVLTWRSVRRKGGRGPLTWQPIDQT